MSEYYDDPLVTLLHGDCIEVMATLPADSVDAVVTDPPYGLEFMGKEWDGPKLWDSRNGSEGAVGQWKDGRKQSSGYGSLLRAGVPAKMTAGPKFQQWCEQWGREALRVTKPGGYLLAFGGTRTHHRLVCALEDAGWIIRDELDWIYASGFPKGKANLKPAHEPIVLARKPGPLRPLAIDECRVGTSKDVPASLPQNEGVAERGWGYGPKPADATGMDPNVGRWPSNVLLSDPELFDEPNPYVVGSGATDAGGAGKVEVQRATSMFGGGGLERDFPFYGDSGGYSRFFIVPKADRAERERGLADRPKSDAGVLEGSKDGSINKWSNGAIPQRANVHPTVKPIDLMRHLVRLVTPAGGVVLDPFLGSGTTCLAASELGVRSIGIEREAEYLEIAKGRLMATPMGLGLEVI